jgi:hypothetical protein
MANNIKHQIIVFHRIYFLSLYSQLQTILPIQLLEIYHYFRVDVTVYLLLAEPGTMEGDPFTVVPTAPPLKIEAPLDIPPVPGSCWASVIARGELTRIASANEAFQDSNSLTVSKRNW